LFINIYIFFDLWGLIIMMNLGVAMYKKFLLFMVLFLMIISSLAFAFDGIVYDNRNDQIDVCNTSHDSVMCCDSTDRFIDIRNFIQLHRIKLEDSYNLYNFVIMSCGIVGGVYFCGPAVGVLLMSIGVVSKRHNDANKPGRAPSQDVHRGQGRTPRDQGHNDANKPGRAPSQDVRADMKVGQEEDGTRYTDVLAKYKKMFNGDDNNYVEAMCSVRLAGGRVRNAEVRVGLRRVF
jgi:hypothetical protein